LLKLRHEINDVTLLNGS